MPEHLRTFIAIPVLAPAGVVKFMSSLGQLSGPLRIIDRNQLHLTVCFLGETRWNQVSVIGKVIDQVAEQVPEHTVTLRGIGAFPRLNQPRVIWAGLSPTDEIIQLAEKLADELEELGFQREKRRYKPHLTLARIKGRPPKVLPDFINNHSSDEFGELLIDEIVLYQSELTPNGPVYTPLSRHDLAEPQCE